MAAKPVGMSHMYCVEHPAQACAAGFFHFVAFAAPIVALVSEHFGSEVAEYLPMPDVLDRLLSDIAEIALDLATRLCDATDGHAEIDKWSNAECPPISLEIVG
jgi:hypothetical protein